MMIMIIIKLSYDFKISLSIKVIDFKYEPEFDELLIKVINNNKNK